MVMKKTIFSLVVATALLTGCGGSGGFRKLRQVDAVNSITVDAAYC